MKADLLEGCVSVATIITTKLFVMKSLLKPIAYTILGFFFLSFQRTTPRISNSDKSLPANSYSFDVLDGWMKMQITLMSKTPALFNGPFIRIYSYSGLAAYRSILPGLGSKFLIDENVLNGFPQMPGIEAGKKYHWPSSVNAALAFMNRAMFPGASPENKAAIDSLEQSFKNRFLKDADTASIERSVQYGKAIAQKIYEWGETDGYRRANDPYTVPIGPGKWVPTAPNYIRPVTPHWGKLRTMVTNSNHDTEPPPPPEYSEDTASFFYKMNKEIYEADLHLTQEQKDFVLFWRDINPGVSAPGHWLNILRQVFQKEKNNAKLDKAAYAYALTGLSLNDAWIGCWKTRYEYNLLRPITYVRQVMGHHEWLPLLITPPHPEYTSGFASMAGSVSESLAAVFGNNYKITDHTYDQFGLQPRSFSSFYEMAREAADSKFYGGIHYKLSVDAGLEQGQKVARNIIKATSPKSGVTKPK